MHTDSRDELDSLQEAAGHLETDLSVEEIDFKLASLVEVGLIIQSSLGAKLCRVVA
jgi:hypothetical protein